jgi:hypothetical protein
MADSETAWLVAGIVAAIAIGAGMYALGIPPVGTPAHADTGANVCQDAFGDEWTYNGYSTGANPPVVMCDGPNDQRGIVDMPPAMQDDLGIVTADANATTGGGEE